jgi:bacteriorhodopsin
MASSSTITSVGAVCFGVAVGYITYRTLVRTTDKTDISDLATVVGAVGGGAVTGLFNPSSGDTFGWYAIGLLGGMVVFFVLYLILNGPTKTAGVMGAKDIGPGASGPRR